MEQNSFLKMINVHLGKILYQRSIYLLNTEIKDIIAVRQPMRVPIIKEDENIPMKSVTASRKAFDSKVPLLPVWCSPYFWIDLKHYFFASWKCSNKLLKHPGTSITSVLTLINNDCLITAIIRFQVVHRLMKNIKSKTYYPVRTIATASFSTLSPKIIE